MVLHGRHKPLIIWGFVMHPLTLITTLKCLRVPQIPSYLTPPCLYLECPSSPLCIFPMSWANPHLQDSVRQSTRSLALFPHSQILPLPASENTLHMPVSPMRSQVSWGQVLSLLSPQHQHSD